MTNPVATIQLGDCRDIIAELPDNSIDSIVTDPPYGIEFMGKEWDSFRSKKKSEKPGKATAQTKTWCSDESSGIGVGGPRFSTQTRADALAFQQWFTEVATELMRVLKPGGHALVFGGTRMYHRMVCGMEDAGFEIRDSIHWLYGSGFPKSLDVSKAIDKQRDDRADVEKVVRWMEATRQASGVTRRQVEEAFGTVNIGQAFFTITPGSAPRVPTLEQVPVLLDLFGLALDDVPEDVRRLLWDLNGRKGQPGENWAKREVVGERSVPVGHAFAGPVYGGDSSAEVVSITAPATDAARQWEGWGTALKPAHEPIVVARKPLSGTVAATVLEHGTGALNIDGCRVGSEGWTTRGSGGGHLSPQGAFTTGHRVDGINAGRWPANIVIDDVIAGRHPEWGHYFYCAKPGKKERNVGGDNKHPTVKPVELMRWLVRLVTPPGGTVLEPFAGSGTTMAAAILEGFHVIGCELTADYLPIIEGRIAWAHKTRHTTPNTLFDPTE